MKVRLQEAARRFNTSKRKDDFENDRRKARAPHPTSTVARYGRLTGEATAMTRPDPIERANGVI